MDVQLYRKYLNQYVQEALQNSDGSVHGASEYLGGQSVGGLLVRHKAEKMRALDDAQKAFGEHRHWPLEIVLSHLGIEDLPGKAHN